LALNLQRPNALLEAIPVVEVLLVLNAAYPRAFAGLLDPWSRSARVKAVKTRLFVMPEGAPSFRAVVQHLVCPYCHALEVAGEREPACPYYQLLEEGGESSARFLEAAA
jgi:hypothetical protein